MNIKKHKLEMSDLAVDNGTILTIKNVKVRVIEFGGMGDDRCFVVPLKGTILWRGKTYRAGMKVGAPLTVGDVKRALAHGEL